MARNSSLLALAICLGTPALMGAKVPPAGDDYHVPLFVRDMGEFWDARVLGETAVARNETPAAAALIESTLGRCPAVSTLVFEPTPDSSWSRIAEFLVAVQATKRTVALRGETTDRGLTGTGLIQSEAKLPKANAKHAVLTLTDDLIQVDGETVCELQPNTPLCEGSFAGLRAALGGRAVVLHASPLVSATLVMKLAEALIDHELHYGVTGKKGELRTFDVLLLQGRRHWVQQACEKSLTGP
jgi:hypothetical protein